MMMNKRLKELAKIATNEEHDESGTDSGIEVNFSW